MIQYNYIILKATPFNQNPIFGHMMVCLDILFLLCLRLHGLALETVLQLYTAHDIGKVRGDRRTDQTTNKTNSPINPIHDFCCGEH